MSETNRALIRDFVEWVAAEPRPYAEVMEAWRTSCPRLTIWEDSVDQGLVVRESRAGVAMVRVTARGRSMLDSRPGAGVGSREPSPDA